MIIRPEAKSDLSQAYAWYEGHRPGLGAEFMLCIEDVFERIQRNPLLHAIVHRSVRRTLSRRFPFAIYYRQEADDIVIIAVIHSRRDPQVWRSRI